MATCGSRSTVHLSLI